MPGPLNSIVWTTYAVWVVIKNYCFIIQNAAMNQEYLLKRNDLADIVMAYYRKKNPEPEYCFHNSESSNQTDVLISIHIHVHRLHILP